MQPDEYARFTRPHQRFLRQLALDLEFFVADTDKDAVFSIDHRVKSFASASAKSRRLGIQLPEMQDIAGMRIVVTTSEFVEIVVRFFETRSSIAKDLTIHKREPIKRTNGYRSTHLITEFSGHYSRSVFSGHLEIQIPTIFEHAFNFVSHSWVYKSSTLHRPQWQEKFRELSVRLAGIDEAATELHRSASNEAELNPEEEPLTPFLYQRIVREEFGEEVALDAAVDAVKSYIDLGATTVAALQRFFRRDDIVALWNEFGNQEPRFSRDTFWHIFGTRMPVARELLESFRDKSKKVDVR